MTLRESGILLHISSLPSNYGIGTFGKAAYDFVDFLVKTKQTYWQILPLTTTGFGDSPYQSFSAVAGNTNFIDFDILKDKGYLTQNDLIELTPNTEDSVDYAWLQNHRRPALEQAVKNFLSDGDSQNVLDEFVSNNSWVKDYALFMAIKEHFNSVALQKWPDKEALTRQPVALKKYQEELKDLIDFHLVCQYFFFTQWKQLKSYANEKGIKIIGDMPIYVSADSVEVWTMPKLFQLDENRNPTAFAGVPGDDFSADGQFWGNPLYAWDYHKQTHYAWWVSRVKAALDLYDYVRIDHFKGFSDFWAIRSKNQSANDGQWCPGPGVALFDAIKEQLGEDVPIIAENLGYIDKKAQKLLNDTGFPGMKIMEFGFYDTDGESIDIPHNYTENTIAYTGTHDNEILDGWYQHLNSKQKAFVNDYINRKPGEEISRAMLRTLWSTVSRVTIAPMQEILSKPASSRMNTPNTIGNNWKWRMTKDDITPEVTQFLKKITKLYARENIFIKKEEKKLLSSFTDYLSSQDKDLQNMSNQDTYTALLDYTKELAKNKKRNTGKKRLYYISAEFLIGKLLSNNLINLGIYGQVKRELEKAGKSIAQIEDVEVEPSLGNGGLGRLAACFIDSMASLKLPAEGVGLNYHCGLFKQVFQNNEQTAQPDYWINDDSWLIPTDISYDVPFKDFTLKSKLDRIDVLGYHTDTKNYLNLFDISGVDYGQIKDGIDFDKTNIVRNLTLFLYPDDSKRSGQVLRIYQQYFMVSNAAQLLIDEAISRGSNLHDLDEYAYVQINDTHPSMVIPELIRLLVEKHDFDINEAIAIVSKMVGYTNHTILAEALEKWPLDYLEEVVPQLIPYIKVLDQKVKEKYSNPKLQIIDSDDRVHMAHMDIHYSTSVNGVAALHTNILKHSELKEFYDIYPDKFNNKTNGITFRRWLEFANQDLASYIKKLIGTDYLYDANKLEDLAKFADDDVVLEQLDQIKHNNKLSLKRYLHDNKGIELDENSIIDTQIKRFHEYKRQQMNALYVIHKYLEIKRGNLPQRKITIIFGGKAAPAYTIAQDIIHLILCLSELINNDPEVSPYLNVFLIDNYNVTVAENLIPASDISEQISLASKEASGTSNMKFMLNGALTLGTLDGANVEIKNAVGDDNIYIFGKDSDTIINLYATNGYHAQDYYENDPVIKEAVDFINSDTLLSLGNPEKLNRLHHELITKDWFMTLIDFKEYIDMKERVYNDYEDHKIWLKKSIINISKAGFFSSDRTIKQYNQDIWHIKPNS